MGAPPSRNRSQDGQATVEWVALVGLVSVLFAFLVAAGVRVPGTALAESLASRLICAVSLSGGCDSSESPLVSVYGSDLAALLRDHAPTLLYERGMHALPVDYRACRATACGDGPGRGDVDRSDTGLPVTLFVHVIDCRSEAVEKVEKTRAAGGDCSGDHAGNLYLQYWEYFADSATLRGMPIAGAKGYHADDWEGTEFRINRDGTVDQRASSHNGYNHDQGPANWGSDADIGVWKDATEIAGIRPHGGWGGASGEVFISGGSHAGNVEGDLDEIGSSTPGASIQLIPLEPIALDGRDPGFAITPPWVKDVWSDPEAEGTG